MKAARVFLSPLPSLFLSRLQVPLSFYSPTLSPKRRAQMTSSMPADDVKLGDVAYCKLRNGTSTLGWYECGVLSYPRGEKGVVRVEVVEKLAPQLPDDRANGPAKKQLVSSADGASFTRSLVLAQTAAKALAAQTAGPRKRRQPSCWADEAESWSEETESAPEKTQRSTRRPASSVSAPTPTREGMCCHAPAARRPSLLACAAPATGFTCSVREPSCPPWATVATATAARRWRRRRRQRPSRRARPRARARRDPAAAGEAAAAAAEPTSAA